MPLYEETKANTQIVPMDVDDYELDMHISAVTFVDGIPTRNAFVTKQQVKDGISAFVNDATTRRMLITLGCIRNNFGSPSFVLPDIPLLIKSKLTDLTLEYLFLDSADAIIISKHLTQSNLRRLSLKNNNIQVEGAHAIAKAIPTSRLRALDFSLNYLKGIAVCAKDLLHPQIQSLELYGCRLNTIDMVEIAAHLQFSNLETLAVNGNGYEDTAVVVLANALTLCPTMRCLGLSAHHAGVKEILNVLPNTNITDLKVRIQFPTTPPEMIEFVENLQHTNLRSLAFSRIRTPQNMQFTLPMSLQRLQTSGWIQSPSILGDMIIKSNLQVLDLTYDGWKTTDAITILNAVSQSPIQALSLEGNQIFGTEEFATALSTCKNLIELNLSRNAINDTGMQYIAAVLPSMRLQILEIAANPFQVDGALSLIKVLPLTYIHSLNLDLSGCPGITTEVSREMQSFLRHSFVSNLHDNPDLINECSPNSLRRSKISTQLQRHIIQDVTGIIMQYVFPPTVLPRVCRDIL
jgi:Ran GTPase-activating protein (RanGAP) involved in mRNA processing and transport